MEEFGDWIYILLIIIVGVSSLIGSVRKKARQMADTNQPREINTENSDEDNFWGDFIPPAEKKPVPISNRKKDTPRSYTSLGKQYKSFLDSRLEGQTAIAVNPLDESEALNAVEENVSISVEDIPKEAGEWRKVFIYNEIFSRKN